MESKSSTVASQACEPGASQAWEPGAPQAWEFVPVADEPNWCDSSLRHTAEGHPGGEAGVVDSRALFFAALGAALLLAALVLM